MIRIARRPLVALKPVEATTTSGNAATPAVGVENTFQLGGPATGRSGPLSASLLTAADLGLAAGPTPVSGRAIVADALELLSESGTSASAALLESAKRLEVPLQKNDGWVSTPFVTALGPAVLPVLDAGPQTSRALSQWQLSSVDPVMPMLLEHGQTSLGLFKQRLRALATNPSLSDDQRLALHDALVRTEVTQVPSAPAATVPLEVFVENVMALGQGQAFARALPVIAAALERGHPAAPESIRAVADRALESADVATRAWAAALFWRSSRTSESAVKAYLRSVFQEERTWSGEDFDASAYHFERNPDAEGAKAVQGLRAGAAQLVSVLLRSAPAEAQIIPVVEAALAPSAPENAPLRLLDSARAALAWSTLPVEKRLPAVDLLHGHVLSTFGRSHSTGRLISGLLNERPDLAALAPLQLMNQLGISTMRVDDVKKTAEFRALAGGDYLRSLRAMKSKLEADSVEQNDSVRLRLEAINEVLEKPVFGTLVGDREVDVAVAQGRELGLSPETIFEALRQNRFTSPSSFAVLGRLLLDRSIPEELIREHLPGLLLRVERDGELPDLLKTLWARRPSKELMADVLTRAHQLATPPGVDVYFASGLVDAGFSKELALSLLAPGTGKFDHLHVSPSSELPRGMRDVRATRLTDFRQRAAGLAPFEMSAPKLPNEPPDWWMTKLAEVFATDTLTATDAELDARFGALGQGTQPNSMRFLVDVRRGLPYAQLKERHAGLKLDWAFADQAPLDDQLRVLLAGQVDTTHWLVDLASVASPALTPAAKQRGVLDALSYERLSTDSTNFSIAMPVRAMIEGWPGSLDFVLPTIDAAVLDGSLRAQTVTALAPLLMSPKVTKAKVLELVWHLAEMANRTSSLGKKRGPDEFTAERDAAVFALVHDFVLGRGDLNDDERIWLRKALAVLQ